MEVLAVLPSDDELVRLHLEDVLGGAFQRAEYDERQRSVVVFVSDAAALKDSLDRKWCDIDAGHRYEVRKYLPGMPGDCSMEAGAAATAEEARPCDLPAHSRSAAKMQKARKRQHRSKEADSSSSLSPSSSVFSSQPSANEVSRDVASAYSAADHAATVEEMAIPNSSVPYVIGKSGRRIDAIRTQTGCDIKIRTSKETQNQPDGKCPITISGPPNMVGEARLLIDKFVGESLSSRSLGFTSTSTQPSHSDAIRRPASTVCQQQSPVPLLQPSDLNLLDFDLCTCLVDVPVDKCGLVIGKGHVTINNISKSTRTTIISPKSPGTALFSCFTIKGSRQQIQQAINKMSALVKTQLTARDANVQAADDATTSGFFLCNLPVSLEESQLREHLNTCNVECEGLEYNTCNSTAFLRCRRIVDAEKTCARIRSLFGNASAVIHSGNTKDLLGNVVVSLKNISPDTCGEALGCWLSLAVGRFPHTLCYSTLSQSAIAVFEYGDVDTDRLSDWSRSQTLDSCAIQIQFVQQSSQLVVSFKAFECLDPIKKCQDQFKTATKIELCSSNQALLTFGSCTDADEVLVSMRKSQKNYGMQLVPFYREIGVLEAKDIFYFSEANAMLTTERSCPPLPQLVVTGLAADVDLELLTAYFSRIGGGDVRSLTHSNGRALATYADASNCYSVSGKKTLSFYDQELLVTLKVVVPQGSHHDDKVILRNVSEASADYLKYLLWAVSGQPPHRLDFIRLSENRELCVLVHFHSPVDFQWLWKGLQVMTLDSAFIEPEQLPLACSVLARNLPANAHRDRVELAFYKAGRPIVSCEPHADGVWKIAFSRPDHASEVLKQTIMCDSVLLGVSMYSTYSVERLAARRGRREMFLGGLVPLSVLEFVVQARRPDLDSLLQRFGCSYIAASDTCPAAIVFTCPPLNANYSAQTKKWATLNVALAKFFQRFSEAEVCLPASEFSQEAGQALHPRLAAVVQECATCHDLSMKTEGKRDEKVIRLIGKRDAVERVHRDLEAARLLVRAEAERQATKTTDTETGYDLVFIELFIASGHAKQLQDAGVDVQVITDLSKKTIAFLGSRGDIAKAKDSVRKLCQQSVRVPQDVSRTTFELLSTSGFKNHVDRTLEDKKLARSAVWSLAAQPSKSVIVCAVDASSANAARLAILGEIAEKRISLPRAEPLGGYAGSTCRSALQSLQQKHNDHFRHVVERAHNGTASIVVSCKATLCSSIMDEIRRLVEANSVKEDQFRFDPVILHYVVSNRAAVERIEKEHAEDCVSVVLTPSAAESGTLCVKGTEKGRRAFVTALKLSLGLDKLCKCSFTVETPGATKYFSKGARTEDLQTISSKTKAVVRLDVQSGRGEASSRKLQGLDSTSGMLVPSELASSQYGAAALIGNSVADQTRGQKGAVQLRLVQGSLVEQKADVLVVPVQRNLDLSASQVARSLLHRASPDLQQRLRQDNPLGVTEGDVTAITDAGLPCCLVLFACCPDARSGGNGGNCETRLMQLILTCLKMTSLNGLSSIAMPAMGTGLGNYAPDAAARAMLEAVQQYDLDSTTKMPLTVLLIFFEELMMAVFHKVLAHLLASTAGDLGSTAGALSQVTDGVNAKDLDGPVSKTIKKLVDLVLFPQRVYRGVHVMLPSPRREAIQVQVVQGSLVDQTADAYIVPVHSSLDLAQGRVSQSLLQRAGPALQQLLRQYHPRGIAEGAVGVVSAPPGLACKLVFFVHCPDTKRSANAEALLLSLYRECLQVTESKGLASLAMPAVGTGFGHFTPDASARALFDGIRQHEASGLGASLSKQPLSLIVAIVDPHMLAAYRRSGVERAMAGAATSGSAAAAAASGGAGGQVISVERGTEIGTTWRTKLVAKDSRNEGAAGNGAASLRVAFSACGPDTDCVAHAQQLVRELCSRDMQSKSLSDPKDIIGALTADQWKDIQSYAQKMDVAIKRGTVSGQPAIVLESLDLESLLCAKDELAEVFRQELGTKIAEDELVKSVQWQYERGTDVWCNYSHSLNRKLEEAHKAGGRNRVEYRNGRGAYTISVSRLVDSCKAGAEADVQVRRQSLVAAATIYPSTWSPGRSYEEIPLKDPSFEYQQIYTAFVRSVGQVRNVIEIRRIQNRPLWEQYSALKKQTEENMTKGCGLPAERNLWHGAPANVIPQICKNRFDRSHSGKNATAFGQGVYFARDASYSASNTYSVPDSSGHKHIIYTLVLTGEYEAGNLAMRTPNFKPGSRTVRYESTVDQAQAPSVFVTYHDAQAYPAYVIKFM